MPQFLLEALDKGLLYLLALLGAYLLKQIASHFKGKPAEILARVEAAAMRAAKAVEQRLVGSLKQAASNGRLTPMELKEALEAAAAEALALVKAELGPAGLADLLKLLGISDPDPHLAAHVEAAVHDLRAAKAAA